MEGVAILNSSMNSNRKIERILAKEGILRTKPYIWSGLCHALCPLLLLLYRNNYFVRKEDGMNVRLKQKIWERGMSQLAVAREAGINDTTLSKIIQGWSEASVEVKLKLATVLGCEIDEIFPENREDKVNREKPQ